VHFNCGIDRRIDPAPPRSKNVVNRPASDTVKTFIFLLGPALAAATAFAEPFQSRNVPADAKWVVHLDLENFLKASIGEFLGKELLDKKLAHPIRKMRENLGIDLDWREVQSIAAYGSEFKKTADRHAVLLIRTKQNIPAALDSVIDKLSRTAPGGPQALQKAHEGNATIYTLNGDVFGTAAPHDLFLVSRSKEQILLARRVVDGKSPNLTSNNSFPDLREPRSGFLVAAVTEPFSSGIKLPPQAEGLKNAENGRIVAGETGERVFLNLAINTREVETAIRMQQVVQGLIALATLSQAEKPDLQNLVQGTKVSSTNKTVTIEVDIQAADVIARISENRGALNE
jgi:hypothetical protein